MRLLLLLFEHLKFQLRAMRVSVTNLLKQFYVALTDSQYTDTRPTSTIADSPSSVTGSVKKIKPKKDAISTLSNCC